MRARLRVCTGKNQGRQNKEKAEPPTNFIKNESARKLRGGYYTPPDLAGFLARWVKGISPTSILEPSCGDGAFFDALGREGLRNAAVTAFELDDKEAATAQRRAREVGLRAAAVHAGDFLQWAIDQLWTNGNLPFDAVVGNPPFVRYQYLPSPFQVCAERIFKHLQLPFTKHTNAWVPFILASMALLRAGGRLAMAVPAEIIHVTYAQSLRSYLGRECRRIVIIDPEEIWFSDTLQGVVLLLAEKRCDKADKPAGLGIYQVKGREFLDLDPAEVFAAPDSINGKTVQGKWTRALLDRQTRMIIDELADHREVHRFEDIAQVDVGIVTGANKFFLVTDEVVRRYQLDKWAYPMFGRSEHCPGLIYDQRQHQANARNGNPTNFLWFNERANIDPAAKAYIKLGEQQELHTRYKCRIRLPWYTVPSVYAAAIGMLKRAHHAPRLILNQLAAYTTDTAYRIRVSRPGIAPETLVGCFVNPLTALSAELEGRHYGGGVLELIPSEIERLIVPLPAKAVIDVVELDTDVRTLHTQKVLARQSKIVLGGLGVVQAKQDCILAAWDRLRARRQRASGELSAAADR